MPGWSSPLTKSKPTTSYAEYAASQEQAVPQKPKNITIFWADQLLGSGLISLNPSHQGGTQGGAVFCPYMDKHILGIDLSLMFPPALLFRDLPYTLSVVMLDETIVPLTTGYIIEIMS